MALAMPSRFAVLKIEDDDFRPPNKSKDKKKPEQKQNGPGAGKKVDNKTGQGSLNKKTAKQAPKNQQSQPKKEKKKRETPDQWEQWKQKDSEFVDGNFEQDIHTAILQSKLDYEQKKDLYKAQKKEAAELEKKTNDAPNCKKKKSKTMTLEQFKNMLTSNEDVNSSKSKDEDSVHDVTVEFDQQFFERIQSETKEELTKEVNKEKLKDMKKVRKSFNNDTITISQLQEKLEIFQTENETLRSNLEKARKEIFAVKTRNKTLCCIIASGEMKDKADVLLELDRLSRVRDELTEEVTRLHGLLEQERSKVGALTAAEPHLHTHNKHSKDKNKKRPTNENMQ